MSEISIFGRVIVVMGGIFLLLGIILCFADKIPWFGKLPGDFMISKKDVSFYFPIATSLLISIIITLFLWLWYRK